MRYRVRQFANLLRPGLSNEEWRSVEAVLSPPLLALFQQMPGIGQRHSMDVYTALARDGCRDADVLGAALLHDVGKGRLHVGHRIAIVLLERLAPRLLAWWATDRPGPWRRALNRAVHHDALGAALVEEAGASAAVVALIRGHERPGALATTDARLSLLRAADDAF
jgi:hypothetical protein